jgi:tetratricopeptide (TPR) repeat protein
LAAGVVLLLAAGTFTRNAVWTSTERMWTDAATKSPKKARPWYQLGALREIRGLRAPAGSEARERELMEAERLYGKALRIAPHRIFYEESLRRVRAIRSGDADQLVLVATARLEHGKPEEAVPLLREAEALDDGRGDVPYYLAIALARVGRGPEALAAMRRAMARGFDDPEFLRTDEALAPVRALPGFPDLFQ